MMEDHPHHYALVFATCITYFVVIFGGQYLMKSMPAYRFQALFQLHNLLLTLVSGALLALMVEQLAPILYHHGLLYAICAQDAWTQPLELLYYLNYLVKYWELLDTVFLVVKKKKLGKSSSFSKSLDNILTDLFGIYRVFALLSSQFDHGALLLSVGWPYLRSKF